MFKMNRKMEYALMALKHMSQKAPGQLTSAKEICETFQIPFDPTSRVLQIMAQKGLLGAGQGIYGGYQILKDLAKVSLGELNDMIVGPIEIATCVADNRSECELNGSCRMSRPMAKLNGRIQGLFDTIKLDEFLEINDKVARR